MSETRWSALQREYEALARELEMPDDMCFVDMAQGCHVGSGEHDHNCTCLNCIRSGAAFEGDE
jgi:hypothetical protein